MHWAASGGDVQLITLALTLTRPQGHTAMHWAASGGDVQLMQWLLSLGAEVSGLNTSDATPLHAAAGGQGH